MEIPEAFECDVIPEPVEETTAETIEKHIPNAKYIEPSHISIATSDGYDRTAVISVTFGPEDRIKMGYFNELGEATGLSVKSIRLDKNRAYLY